MKSLLELRQDARVAAEAYADTYRKIFESLRSGEGIVECAGCDNVFVVPPTGQRTYKCHCGEDNVARIKP